MLFISLIAMEPEVQTIQAVSSKMEQALECPPIGNVRTVLLAPIPRTSRPALEATNVSAAVSDEILKRLLSPQIKISDTKFLEFLFRKLCAAFKDRNITDVSATLISLGASSKERAEKCSEIISFLNIVSFKDLRRHEVHYIKAYRLLTFFRKIVRDGLLHGADKDDISFAIHTIWEFHQVNVRTIIDIMEGHLRSQDMARVEMGSFSHIIVGLTQLLIDTVNMIKESDVQQEALSWTGTLPELLALNNMPNCAGAVRNIGRKSKAPSEPELLK